MNSIFKANIGKVSLAVFLILSAAIHFWGIRQDLPYSSNIDEPVFVDKAVNIIATGDLNPHWFGNPGSTVIYPLAILYKISYGLKNWRDFIHPIHGLKLTFSHADAKFYYMGRALSIFYNILSLVFIFLIGAKIFNIYVGVMGGGLYIFCITALENAQIVRTDSAAVFFGMMALWFCLKAYEDNKVAGQVLAGIAIGLSIASRYFMIALIPILLAVNILQLFRAYKARQLNPKTWQSILIGLFMIPVAFLTITPYFLFDFTTVLKNVTLEARSIHPGADGLTPVGNFVWYITKVIPLNLGVLQMIMACAGFVVCLIQKNIKAGLLILYIFIFMLGISLSGLHWARWAIQILPILCIFAALAAVQAVDWAAQYQPWVSKYRVAVYGMIFLLLSVQPALGVIRHDVMQSRYSTNIKAYEWIYENIPRGARIVYEWNTAPLYSGEYIRREENTLANFPLETYLSQNYEYFVVSDGVYTPYLNESKRFAKEASFYNMLFKKGTLLSEIKPLKNQRGPKISIYRVEKK